MTPLENDPESGCWGCGPANAAGLGLSFARDGDAVACEHVARPEQTGWPERLHGGVMFTLLMETSYWTVIGLRDRIGAVSGPMTYSIEALPRVGTRVLARGRIEAEGDEGWSLRAEARDEKGRLLATLASKWRRVNPDELDRFRFTPSMRVHIPPA